MINYYEVLGVEMPAAVAEIKRSFRRRAKEIHPDVTGGGKEYAEEQMRLLLTAYHILVDPKSREEYDKALQRELSRFRFDYREYLSARARDYVSQSKLILYDLLHSRDDDAVLLYEALLERTPSFRLEHFLDYEDYMDCAFLLAEAFDDRSKLVPAYGLYKQVYIFETERPYFHHFVDEVVDRLRNLVCFKMVSNFAPHVVVFYVEDLLTCNFSRKENAFLYKKLAELYATLGKQRMAQHYLRKGLTLDSKLAGVKKLKEKIGFSEASL